MKLQFKPRGFYIRGRAIRRLSPQLGRFLLVLMGRPFVSYEFAAEALWPNPDLMPDTWLGVLRTYTYRLNHSLEGWKVTNVHGIGWRLDEALSIHR